MRTLCKLLAVLLVSLGLTVISKTPAQAATNNWTFNGGCCIYIPGGSAGTGFTTTVEKDIYFKISSWSPCNTSAGPVEIYIKLYKNDLFDHEVGNTKYETCTGTVKWSMVNPGKYYFYMRVKGPWDKGSQSYYTASGQYAFNGSTL